MAAGRWRLSVCSSLQSHLPPNIIITTQPVLRHQPRHYHHHPHHQQALVNHTRGRRGRGLAQSTWPRLRQSVSTSGLGGGGGQLIVCCWICPSVTHVMKWWRLYSASLPLSLCVWSRCNHHDVMSRATNMAAEPWRRRRGCKQIAQTNRCAARLNLKLTFRTKTRTNVIWQKAESFWHVHPTPRLYSPGGSIRLTVWPQYDPESALPLGVKNTNLTQCVIGPYKCICQSSQIASKSIERFKQEAWMWQTDRQTTLRRNV